MTSTQSLGPDAAFVNAGGMITMEGPVVLDRGRTALAVRGGRIVALGTDAAIRALAGSVPVTDLDGAFVMPGLIDSHNHFLNTALGWERVQLADARTIEELVDVIGQRAKETPRGEWILCSSRWHETNLAEGRLPLAAEIDRVTPNHPVYLPRGGHVVVTNSLGLERAGISHGTTDPEGGEFVRDGSGKLTGMLLERPAFRKLTALLPQPAEEDRRQALRNGIRVYNQSGITTVRDPALTEPEIRTYQAIVPELHAMRTSLMWRVDLAMAQQEREAWAERLDPVVGAGDDWLQIWGLKVTIDGGVEAGYFNQPYANNSEFSGYPLTTGEQLELIVGDVQRLGWRIGIHVVGDAAMAMALDSFEKIHAHTPVDRAGHVLEHAFAPSDADFDRTGTMGIGVTLQHALVYSLAGNMLSYWGDQRAEDCTPSRAWLDSGVVVGAGTDSPVTNFDPWLNIYGFATRDTQVAGVLGPQHRISVAETLRAYTVGSAEILGQSRDLGSLAEGKVGDFICMDRDPLAGSPDDVRGTVVKRTFVAGRQVFPA